MKKVAALFIVSLCLAAFAAPSPAHHRSDKIKAKKLYNCQIKTARAIAKFEKRRYIDAQTILMDVKLNCSGNENMDTVLYYLALSYMRQKKFIEAQGEFEQLTREFTQSAFAVESEYRVGYCDFMNAPLADLDQNATRDAIRKLQDFMDANQDSPFGDSAKACIETGISKLAEKEFLNARFYEKSNRFESAVVYYRIVIDEFPQTAFANKSRLGMAEALYKLNRQTEALGAIDDLLTSSPDAETKEKALVLRDKLDPKPALR